MPYRDPEVRKRKAAEHYARNSARIRARVAEYARTHEVNKVSAAARSRKYRMSERGKATRAAYRERDYVKAGAKAYGAKYRATAEGKAVILRSREMQKSNKSHRRYHATSNYKEGQSAYWRSAAGKRVVREHLLRGYGLDTAAYANLLAAQGGVCKICKVAPVPGKHLHVDHNHATGEVRGLLCHRCNTALGLLGDSVVRLDAAACYLRASCSPACDYAI